MATHPGPEDHSGAPRLTSAEFDALFTQLREATARGPDDRRGALNNLTPAEPSPSPRRSRRWRPRTIPHPAATR